MPGNRFRSTNYMAIIAAQLLALVFQYTALCVFLVQQSSQPGSLLLLLRTNIATTFIINSTTM